MKTKHMKCFIVFLFVLFNALSVITIIYLKNKIELKHDINNSLAFGNLFKDYTINEELITKPKTYSKLVLVDPKKNIYNLVKNDYDFDALLNVFDENIYSDFKYEMSMDTSKLFVDDKVMKYNDKLGFYYIDDELNRVEVYDFDKLIGANDNLDDYSKIKKALGEGVVIKTHKDSYDYYILTYKHDGIFIQFISYYEDGRNNLCVLAKNIIM